MLMRFACVAALATALSSPVLVAAAPGAVVSPAATTAPAPATSPTLSPALAPVAFLRGVWSGGGLTDAGAGSGQDTWTAEAGGNALVRRSHAEYSASSDRAASTYDAVMIVYRDPATGQLRADYVDSGAHVIHYALVPGAGAKIARFVSDAVPGAPRFRLTYTGAADDASLEIVFELAPPGSAAFVRTIARGTARRIGPLAIPASPAP